MFTQDQTTEFLSIQSEKSSVQFNSPLIALAQFYLGEQHVIHNRRVYDQMQLLGNLGGLLGSLMLIGAGLHFLIVDNTLPIQLMKHYFIVDNNDRDDETIQRKQKS